MLSSCGLIERFKTPEQPTDSKDAVSEAGAPSSTSDASDDLFTSVTNDANNSSTQTDAPSNINTANTGTENSDADLKSLEDEFSSAGPRESVINEKPATTPPPIPPKVTETPVVVEESLPEIKEEIASSSYNASGAIEKYRVEKGDTLMQIAFKIYGDMSKWKEIKNLNSDKISSNNSLAANTEIKYRAPETPFVWNPSGNPYLIKNGDTLGIISNNVYSTPKKWKAIWDNNRPLIKNPDLIFAGFTLYYKEAGEMANYVQPQKLQPKVKKEIVTDEISNEEVVAQTEIASEAAANLESLDSTTQAQAATERDLDLINNISVPAESESAIDIDEEIQSL